jgi:ribonuclease VapC
MFIDTSAFIALLTDEPEAADLAAALNRARRRVTSPMVRLETAAALSTRLDISPLQAEALFDELIAEAEIAITPITDAIGRLAVQCFAAYGKGRHPARLKIVDCFSYACAKALREPLLFKGDDFPRTDVQAAGM